MKYMLMMNTRAAGRTRYELAQKDITPISVHEGLRDKTGPSGELVAAEASPGRTSQARARRQDAVPITERFPEAKVPGRLWIVDVESPERPSRSRAGIGAPGVRPPLNAIEVRQ